VTLRQEKPSDYDTAAKEWLVMSKAITMRIDDALKQQAEETLEEIGLSMTTYITSSLKALVREQRVPFELVTQQRANEAYLAKLDDALDSLVTNGGYEYLGKDEDGFAKFSDTPVKVIL
jgi:DNA-damage-inducible protein J